MFINKQGLLKPKTKPDTYQAVLNLLCGSFEIPLVKGKPSP